MSSDEIFRAYRMLAKAEKLAGDASVAKAFQEFGEQARMRPSPYYDRVVDVMEELVKFTRLTRGASANLTDRYCERASICGRSRRPSRTMLAILTAVIAGVASAALLVGGVLLIKAG